MASPPPLQDPMGSQRWLEWFRAVNLDIQDIGNIAWSQITDFSGSNITDIASRAHNNLQSMQGGTTGQYYHLTSAQHAALTAGPHNNLSGLQGGTSGEYYHLTNSEHTAITSGDFSGTNAVLLPSYTVSGVPTASSYTGGLIYVSDETGGATVAFSDGTNWRRVQDRAIVS